MLVWLGVHRSEIAISFIQSRSQVLMFGGQKHFRGHDLCFYYMRGRP